MKPQLSAILGLSLLLALPSHAEVRTWTNTEGKTMQAEFVKAEGDNVTLRLQNGRISTFPQSKLAQADIDFIKKQQQPAEDSAPQTAATVSPDRKAKWLKKMDRAQEEAKETGLPILVLFTGTSWCPYCVKLEEAVFSKKEFKEFANQNLVLLMLDFEAGGKAKNRKDEALSKEFGVKGFPTYFLTDATGKPLGSYGYNEGITPESFAAWVKRYAPAK